jgi:hypothetical protein
MDQQDPAQEAARDCWMHEREHVTLALFGIQQWSAHRVSRSVVASRGVPA